MDTKSDLVYCEKCKNFILRNLLQNNELHYKHAFTEITQFVSEFDHKMNKNSDFVLSKYTEITNKITKYEIQLKSDLISIEKALQYIQKYTENIQYLFSQLKSNVAEIYKNYQDEQIELYLLENNKKYTEILEKEKIVENWENIFSKEFEDIKKYQNITDSFNKFLQKVPQFPTLFLKSF